MFEQLSTHGPHAIFSVHLPVWQKEALSCCPLQLFSLLSLLTAASFSIQWKLYSYKWYPAAQNLLEFISTTLSLSFVAQKPQTAKLPQWVFSSCQDNIFMFVWTFCFWNVYYREVAILVKRFFSAQIILIVFSNTHRFFCRLPMFMNFLQEAINIKATPDFSLIYS